MIDPKTKFKLFKQSKNFCAVPWTNFEVYSNGKVETCGRGRTTLGNLHEESIESILKGEVITQLRKDMLNDIPNKNCVACQTQSKDDDGYYFSELIPISGVIDLTRIDRQQYVVMQLINDL